MSIAVCQTSLGLIYLRADSQDRICQLEFHRGSATYFSGSPINEFLLEQVLAVIEGKEKQHNIPISFEEGTEFQELVWQNLITIPYGATISYHELANNIGKPNAVRAVANACGANPIPILVPCHRVIKKDGSLGGYTGGIKIKKQLLTREQIK